MADLFGWINSFAANLGANWGWIVGVIITLVFLIVVVIVLRNRAIYQYPVRIFRIRENNKCLEKNYKGGYISRRNSAPFFRIKTGKFPWQHIDLTTTPNPAYLDEQSRVYYKQIDVGTYIQLRREMSNPQSVNYAPVECDVKYGAVLDIHRIRNVLKTESTIAKLGPYIALVLLFIAAIVGWWFVMNAKCPGVG